MSNKVGSSFGLIDSVSGMIDCCNLKVQWRDCDPGTVFDDDSGDCVLDCKNDYGKKDHEKN